MLASGVQHRYFHNYVYCEMITTVTPVNIATRNTKCFFLVTRTFEIYSLAIFRCTHSLVNGSQCAVRHTPSLTSRVAGGLCFLTIFTDSCFYYCGFVVVLKSSKMGPRLGSNLLR